MKLKNIVLNGTHWLGHTVTNTEGKTVGITKALQINPNNAQKMADYVKAKNSKGLVSFSLEGEANTMSVASISPAGKLEYKMLRMRLKAIKASALSQIENNQLDEGKFELR